MTIDIKMDPEKYEQHMKQGFLTGKQVLRIAFWSFFSKCRFCYFYVLCEHGMHGQFAFNKACREETESIQQYLVDNPL